MSSISAASFERALSSPPRAAGGRARAFILIEQLPEGEKWLSYPCESPPTPPLARQQQKQCSSEFKREIRFHRADIFLAHISRWERINFTRLFFPARLSSRDGIASNGLGFFAGF